MLATENHKKLTEVAITAATTAEVLDKLYDTLTSGAYYDTSSRTPGTGSAVKNVAKEVDGVTVAVYGQFADGDLAGVWFIFAGGPAATPTMRAPDTYAAGGLHCGYAFNAGAFDSWDAANPFTSGTFSGYWRCRSTWVIGDVLAVYESQGTIKFTVEHTTGATSTAWVGALWDCDSTEVQDNSDSVNYPGYIFGMMTTGSGAFTGAGFARANNQFTFWYHGGANGDYHAGAHLNGSFVNLGVNVSAMGDSLNNLTTGMTLQSGKPATQGVMFWILTAGRLLGRLREVGIFRAGISGQILQVGGLDKGYLWGSNWLNGNASGTPQDRVLLMSSGA